MNKNKGIIGIGLIIAIVLGIAVVGGGAYYLGTKKNIENNKVIENTSVTNPIEENNSHEVPAGPYGDETNYVAPAKIGTDFDIEGPWPNQTVSQGCTKIKNISAPIILSPNGGEIYEAGQKLTVKWNSCAPVSNNSKNTVGIFIFMTSAPAGTGVELAHITADDGSEVVTLPTLSTWSDMKYGKNFKIEVWYPQYDSIASPSDSSDNSFTINSATIVDLQLTKNDNGKIVNSAKGQVISVTLCNPGDGGAQFDEPKYDSSILNLISHTNVPVDKGYPPVVGGCYGNDVFKFQTLKIGTSKLNITASQPWTGGEKLFPIFSATITVK